MKYVCLLLLMGLALSHAIPAEPVFDSLADDTEDDLDLAPEEDTDLEESHVDDVFSDYLNEAIDENEDDFADQYNAQVFGRRSARSGWGFLKKVASSAARHMAKAGVQALHEHMNGRAAALYARGADPFLGFVKTIAHKMYNVGKKIVGGVRHFIGVREPKITIAKVLKHVAPIAKEVGTEVLKAAVHHLAGRSPTPEVANEVVQATTQDIAEISRRAARQLVHDAADSTMKTERAADARPFWGNVGRIARVVAKDAAKAAAQSLAEQMNKQRSPEDGSEDVADVERREADPILGGIMRSLAKHVAKSAMHAAVKHVRGHGRSAKSDPFLGLIGHLLGRSPDAEAFLGGLFRREAKSDPFLGLIGKILGRSPEADPFLGLFKREANPKAILGILRKLFGRSPEADPFLFGLLG